MGKEIELKIPLDDAKHSEIFESIYIKKIPYEGLEIIDSSANEIIKCDEYFTKYNTLEERKAHNEPSVIRIRTEDGKTYFCLKRKTYANGIEQNQEYESSIEDTEVLRQFFTEAGYHRWFYKEKKAFSAHCKFADNSNLVFHLELVCVNGLKYAEVEVTTETGDEATISAELEKFVKKMGLNPEEKDPRSWYKIING